MEVLELHIPREWTSQNHRGAAAPDSFWERQYLSWDPEARTFWKLQETKYNFMLSFPIADKQELFGVIRLNSTTMKTFAEGERYFIPISTNLIISAVKLRKRFTVTDWGVA